MTGLLPCPFCGGPAQVFQKHREPKPRTLNWRVCCDNLDPVRGELCDMAIYSDFETEAEAIAAWNKRPSPLDVMPQDVVDALIFYAEPDTYFAWGFLPDAPCGDWGSDFEETQEDGYKPGKRARAALLKLYEATQDAEEDGKDLAHSQDAPT